MIKYLFFIVAFIFFTNDAFGCSLHIDPTSDFDRTHYIFIGEVVEVIESVKYESAGLKGDAVGFKIKVSENVHLPKSASYLEVFPMRLTTDCRLISDAKDIRERYRVGSQVRVVAKEATVFKNQPNSIVRLETSIYNRGSIARNDLSENLRTSGKTVYDYKSFVERRGASAQEYALSESNYNLPVFELRKDLLRLQESKSEDERTKILERLVFYPYISMLDFPKIARTHLKNQEKFAALEKQWWDRIKEIRAKQQ